MKISVDVEIAPEEMRKLLGLPDFSPAQDLIVERVTRQVEKGLDGQLMTSIMKTVVSGGMQGLEAYQKLVSGILTASGGKSGREEKSAAGRPAAGRKEPEKK